MKHKLNITRTGIDYGFFWITWWNGLPCFDLTIPWFWSKHKSYPAKCLTIFSFKISRHYYNTHKLIDGTLYSTHVSTGLKGVEIGILNQRIIFETEWNLSGNWFEISSETMSFVINIIPSWRKRIYNSWPLKKTKRHVQNTSHYYPEEGFTIDELTTYLSDFYSNDIGKDDIHILPSMMVEDSHNYIRDEDISYLIVSGRLKRLKFYNLTTFNIFRGRLLNLGFEIYTIDDYKKFCKELKCTIE